VSCVQPSLRGYKKTARIGRVTSKHFVKLTTVSGTKNNTHNNHGGNCCVAADKDLLVNTRKNKGVFGFATKDRTGATKTPSLNMNHVTGQYRRNDDNPQNQVNEVEEMETQEGECQLEKNKKTVHRRRMQSPPPSPSRTPAGARWTKPRTGR
jgi:hypothetical protein